MGPAVEHAKQKLQTISSDALPVKQLQENLVVGYRGLISHQLSIIL